MCTVRTLFFKKYSIRMFTKSKFTPAYQITALLLEKPKSWKNSAQCALHCTVCTLFVKKQCIRKITKSLCTPAHQITALQLEKQKSWENSAQCVLCSSKMCTVCTIIAKKYSTYKNVHEIQIHACTPNYSSLA